MNVNNWPVKCRSVFISANNREWTYPGWIITVAEDMIRNRQWCIWLSDSDASVSWIKVLRDAFAGSELLLLSWKYVHRITHFIGKIYQIEKGKSIYRSKTLSGGLKYFVFFWLLKQLTGFEWKKQYLKIIYKQREQQDRCHTRPLGVISQVSMELTIQRYLLISATFWYNSRLL